MFYFQLSKEIGVSSHQRDVIGVELAVHSVPPLKPESDECSYFTKDAAPKIG